MEVVLFGSVLVAGAVAIHSGIRYGDAYRFGDGIYRHNRAMDMINVAAPAAVAIFTFTLLVLSYLTSTGLRDQWRRERQRRRLAQEWGAQRTKR